MAFAAPAAPDGTIATSIGAPPPVAFVADVPLTEAQSAALAALRSRGAAALARVHADDAYWAGDHALARILGARKFDVDKALAMLEEIVRWRNEVQAWRFLDPAFYREPEALRRYFPWGFAGVDREGFPVLVERIGLTDLLGVHDAVGTDEFLRWVIWCGPPARSRRSLVSSPSFRPRFARASPAPRALAYMRARACVRAPTALRPAQVPRDAGAHDARRLRGARQGPAQDDGHCRPERLQHAPRLALDARRAAQAHAP